jgi:hypothetical protein
MATPASIASKVKPVTGARAIEAAAAKKYGQTYTPGQAAGTALAAYQAAQQASSAPAVDSIASAYKPILDFYSQQAQQTQNRYAQNAANLKNIFGALTGLTATDTKRINDQFTSSITKQQADLATRTAEQRAAQTAGETQLAATAAERGNGPALGGSATQMATEQGIGQANAIQSNWEGLMGAQQANAITDVTNRGAGYGQQEIAANAQLSQNLQDALSAINGQTAGIDSQIAQAKISRDQAIASNDYQAAQQAADLANRLAVAKTAAGARIGAAQIAASAKKSTSGTAAKKVTYTKDLTGTLKRIANDYGQASASWLQMSIDNVQSNKVATNPTAAYNLWLKRSKTAFTGVPAAQVMDTKAAAKEYFNGLKYPKASSTSSTPGWNPGG